MKIIAFQEIIELNHILEEKGLSFRIHLRDSCGGQSINIEPLSNCGTEGKNDEMHEVIKEYFSKKRINVQFDESGLFLKLND